MLSLDKSTFPTEGKIVEALRGKPNSADTGLEIASDHPEFFRPNANGENVALLLRSYFTIKDEGTSNETRIP